MLLAILRTLFHLKNSIVLLFFIFLFASQLDAANLHLLICTDNVEVINRKTEYNFSALKNAYNIETSFSLIASTCNLPLHVTKLTSADNTLTRGKIIYWLKNHPIKPDDIVIVYYSGHGARKPKSKTILPFGWFFNEKTQDNEVEFSEIIHTLLLRKAGLYLVLLDCCNVLYSKEMNNNAPLTNTLSAFEIPNIQKLPHLENLKQLFLRKKGLIIVSAASPKEFSWGHSVKKIGNTDLTQEQIQALPWLGSVFTKNFLNELFQETHQTKPRWSTILKQTTLLCQTETQNSLFTPSQEDLNHFSPPHFYQTPQYRLCLQKKRRSRQKYKRFIDKECLLEKTPALSEAPQESTEEITVSEELLDSFPTHLTLTSHS